jgi:hypothetical protein
MLAQVFNPTEIKKKGPAARPANTPARRNGFAFTAASVVLPATSQSYGDARGIVNGVNRRWLVVASSQRRCPAWPCRCRKAGPRGRWPGPETWDYQVISAGAVAS